MRLLRLPQLIERGLGSRTSIYERMGRGEFPKPVKIGRLNGWPEPEVEQYIADRMAEREAVQ